MTKTRRAIWLCAAWAWLAWTGCESDEPSALAALGGGCQLNSDCTGGLVCAYGVCHEECAQSSDCDSGRCVLGEGRVRLCQADGSAGCAFNSDCLEPLICARDKQCRNQCAGDRDCVNGQVCRSATCAEPEELNEDGELEADGSLLGTPCQYHSDCGNEDGIRLACREGACGIECYITKDCPRFYTCNTDDDPNAPGECTAINPDPAKLFCDPRFDQPIQCVCDPTQTVECREDGEGYEECCPGS